MTEPAGASDDALPGDPAGPTPVPERVTDPREPPRASPREAALIAAGVTATTALAVTIAFDPARAGTGGVLAPMGALYVVVAAGAALWLRRRGELRTAMRPVSGDLARGAFVAALLYGVAMAMRMALSPQGSAREAWIMRLYLQVGDPEAAERALVGVAVFLVAALEEISWRGLVMRALEGPLGRERAWLLSSVLFAVAHLPTAWLLRDPTAGLNPLLVLAGFGCSIAWGRVVHRTAGPSLGAQGRLMPAIFAHAFFSWAVVSFPLWRP